MADDAAKPKGRNGLNRRAFLAGSGGAAAGALTTGLASAATRRGAEAKSAARAKPSPPAKSGASGSKNLVSERDQVVDPKTGVRVIQITSYPLPTAPFTYDWPSITPDNQRVVFFAQRFARRDAPWDLFRCDTDGLGLYQLTEYGDRASKDGYYGCPTSVLSLDGRTIFVVWDNLLCGVDVETGKIDEILVLDEVCPEAEYHRAFMSASGDLFLRHSIREPGAIRVNLSTGKAERVDTQGHLMGCFQEEPRLLVERGEINWDTTTGGNGVRTIVNAGTVRGLWNTDEQGGDGKFICPSMFAHMTLLGKKSMVQGCGKRPHKCLWLAEPGKEPSKLVEGPYFWHSGASYDGEWIVADTNTPDEGLQLAHVPTRNFRTLCFAGATQDHYNFGHPHPALSQDGRLAVFRSDRTHVPQIYIAHVTEAFCESIKAGETDAKT